MKKTVYVTCGKAFGTKEAVFKYLDGKYTLAEPFGAYYPKKLDAIRRIAGGEYTSVPKRLKLPESASMKDAMCPVRDQAFRGTCAANAGAALMEYYCREKTNFSVQYLYERMKRKEKEIYHQAASELLAGQPISNAAMREAANSIASFIASKRESGVVTNEDVAKILYSKQVEMDGGSTAEILFEVLGEYGICREEFWPYAREQLDERNWVNDVNNLDMPPGADEDARRHRLCDKPYIFTAPNNVEELKKYLVGDIYHAPMPVYVGVLTFADENGGLPLDNGFARIPKMEAVKIEKAQCEIDSTETLDDELDIRKIDLDTLRPEAEVEVLDIKAAGGHAMLLVGYEDDETVLGGGYFIVRNSWGNGWGEDGYLKMPYAYAEIFIRSAATILRPPADDQQPVTAVDEIPPELKPYRIVADRDMKNSNGVWSIAKGTRVIMDENGVAEPDTALNRKRFAELGYSWSNAARRHENQTKDAPGGDSKSATGSQERGRFFSGLEVAFRQLPIEFPLLGGIKKRLLMSAPKATEFKEVAELSAQLGDMLKIYEVRGSKHSFRIVAAYLNSTADAGNKAERIRTLTADYSASRKFNPCDCTITVIGATGKIDDLVQPYLAQGDVRVTVDNYTAKGGWQLGAVANGEDDAWHEWLKRLAPNTPEQWKAQLAEAWQTIADQGGNVMLEKMAEALKLPTGEVAGLIDDFMAGFRVKGGKVIKE